MSLKTLKFVYLKRYQLFSKQELKSINQLQNITGSWALPSLYISTSNVCVFLCLDFEYL